MTTGIRTTRINSLMERDGGYFIPTRARACFRRLILTLILIPVPLFAQSTHSSNVGDPLYSILRHKLLQTSESAAAQYAILGEIWGTVGLHHAIPSFRRTNWDEVLARGVAAVERAQNTQELAAAINREILAPLGDPLTYAVTLDDFVHTPSYPPALQTHRLGAQVAYVAVTDPRVARRDSFPRLLRAKLDSLAREGNVNAVVVDARTASRKEYFRPAWLRMWACDSLPVGPRMSVFRATDNGGWRAPRWLFDAAGVLVPLGPCITMPTVFLANRASYGALREDLDALRGARRDIAVVFEETGPTPTSWTASVTYVNHTLVAESLAFRFGGASLLSADGSVGEALDSSSARVIPLSELADVVQAALRSRARAAVRPQFQFQPPELRTIPAMPSGLNREQRMAALIKLWTLVKRFNAYPEDANTDWDRVLGHWLPRIAAAPNDSAYREVLRQVSEPLNDSHISVVPSRYTDPYVPPLMVRSLDGRVLVLRVEGDQARRLVAPGDEILDVDGKTVEEIERELLPKTSGSRPDLKLRNIWRAGWGLFGPSGSIARLRIRTANGMSTVELKRTRRPPEMRDLNPFPHPLVEILPRNIGYINSPGLFPSQAVLDSAFVSLKETRGLILDLRGPPEIVGPASLESVIHEVLVAGWFPGMISLESVSYINAGDVVSGFAIPRGSMSFAVRYPDSPPRYDRPLVVIIDDWSQSSGESAPDQLRLAGRASFVGTATAGTTGTAPPIDLPAGTTFRVTITRALFGGIGGRHHRVGVAPDVRAVPTPEGLRSGRDEVRDAAVRELERLISNAARR